MDLQKAEDTISGLLRVRPSIEGNLEAWEYLNGLKTVFVNAERREQNIGLLDPANPEANAFHITNEFTFSNGVHIIRPDIAFLINGIPVIVVETKVATELKGIAKAFEQISSYHRQGPELTELSRRSMIE